MNLANKIRPSSLEDIIGQQEIVTLLQRTVKKKYLSNFIFYGYIIGIISSQKI